MLINVTKKRNAWVNTHQARCCCGGKVYENRHCNSATVARRAAGCGLGRWSDGRRRPQVLADVVEVAQRLGVGAEQRGLQVGDAVLLAERADEGLRAP